MKHVDEHEEKRLNESGKTDEFDNVETMQNTLDRIVEFINNCDTKASIILALIGVIITIIFSGNVPGNFLQMYGNAKELSSFGSVLYIVLCIAAVIAVAAGMILLVSVLFARVTGSSKDSKIYFGDIAENASDENYIEKVKSMTLNMYMEDIARQIYINSKICRKKYHFYNVGLVVGLVGLIGFLALYLVGVRVFL